MSRVLATSGPGVVGRPLILRLLAAGREVRTIVESRTRAAEVRATFGTRDVQPGAHVSFIVIDRDQARRLDAAAGCEFVDDRIRALK
jgi:nucleoside-diphosphate-sugar epimerase